MNQGAERDHAPQAPDSIARNTGFALAMQLTSATFAAGLALFLVRRLGPHGYGVLALAVGLGALVALVSDLGISNSAGRFIAEHRGDHSAVRAVLADAFRLKLLAALVICLLLAVLAGPIADAYGTPSLAWPIRGTAIALFAQSMGALFLTTFEALGRMALALRVAFTESAIETGASIALVLLGAGATGAAFGRAAGFIGAALVGVALTTRLTGWRVTRLRTLGSDRVRPLARYAMALLVIDGAITVFNRMDILLAGAYLGARAAGLFEAAMRMTVFLQYLGLAMAYGVTPRLARNPDHRPEPGAFSGAIRYMIIIQAVLLAPIIVWAGPIVALVLGPGYERSASVLRALAPFVLLSGVAPLVTIGANYLGEARRRIPIAVAAVLLNLAIDVVWIPRIGIVAGSIGSDVAFALYVPAHLWICKRALGFPLRPVILTLGRALIAALAMAGVLLAAGTTHLSPLAWLAGGVGGCMAYMLVLIASREITVGELRALYLRFAPRLRRTV